MATEILLGIVGPGLVGKALLAQILKQASKLEVDLGTIFRVVGIANSRKMLPGSGGCLNLSTWQHDLKERGEAINLKAFQEHVSKVSARDRCHAVIIDCTASDVVPDAYLSMLADGRTHIITPNKRLGAGPFSRYKAVQETCRQTGGRFFYEATVGAGLPIISTLQGLIQTGDKVLEVEGILSGTLSYIFNNFGPNRSFSSVVKEAREAGYTEPDPREDLSGMDVARKVVILARECGLQVELQDVEVQSLVPDPLREAPSAEDFLAGLPQFDKVMAADAVRAASQGKKLCYVGLVDLARGRCKVSLEAYPKEHAFAQLSGSDNIVSFTTQRYSAQPLIVRGPGAGAEVTAAGVFCDLLLLARSQGARC